MMLALAPMGVALPPKPAPIARAHHSGSKVVPCASSPLMIGIMATTHGILSTIADNNAATQRKSTAVSKTCDPAKLARAYDAALNTPHASSPPPAINKEVKH